MPTNNINLPPAATPIVTATGRVHPQWYQYFAQFTGIQGLELADDGIVRKEGDTFTSTDIEGTAGRITVAHGSGVGGSPTINIDPTLIGPTDVLYKAGGQIIPVVEGGTGTTAFQANKIMAGGATTTSSPQFLDNGTSGQVLTSTGASTLPTMQTIVQPGMTLLKTKTASNSTELAFTDVLTSTYKTYKLIISNLFVTSDAPNEVLPISLFFQVSTTNGVTWDNTAIYNYPDALGGASHLGQSAVDFSNSYDYGFLHAEMTLYGFVNNPRESWVDPSTDVVTNYPMMTYWQAQPGYFSPIDFIGAVSINTANSLNAFRFYVDSSIQNRRIQSGTISLYGMAT